MAKQHGAQKFIGRNNPGRVDIQCDEECYGSQVKVKLPFVAGVMADLSGKWDEPEDVPKEHGTARGDLEKRTFLEISQDNFEDRMKAMKPSVAFTVPNAITGKDNMVINLSFEKMEDFAPDKIAERLEPLKQLYETRKALKYLQNMANNKGGIEKILQMVQEKPESAKAIVAMAKMEKATGEQPPTKN